MPTFVTHAIAGAAVAQVLAPCSLRGRMTAVAAMCAMLPDIDVIGLRLGVPYDSLFGHRGITHSVLFAGLVALAISLPLWSRSKTRETLQTLACVFVATVSHGVLDALTNGGLGVAFFAPFNDARYFFPVTPIEVSPLRADVFLTVRGVSVLSSEALWVWCPAAIVAVVARLTRCRA
ncbi:MAG TPA: metal-dependent hydrolase [Bryobacteraceae bacterium]|nr:metal-dependent hydrolase [Bryobacteraceae bacterium]